MKTETLQDLRDSLDASTQGEWRVSMNGYSVKVGDGDEKRVIAKSPSTQNFEEWLANAEFIVSAHNGLGEVLDYVEELEGGNQDLIQDYDAAVQVGRKLGREEVLAAVHTVSPNSAEHIAKYVLPALDRTPFCYRELRIENAKLRAALIGAVNDSSESLEKLSKRAPEWLISARELLGDTE